MLSILIPTYNIDIIPLATELTNLCRATGIAYEILAYDDGANTFTNRKNRFVNNLPHCKFEAFKTNIGRSAIRNKLGQDARNDLLLFIDAGTRIEHSDFIKNYLSHTDKDVVCGGMSASETPAIKPYKLRWLFTKKREFKTLCSSNFLIKKAVLLNHPFDESLKQYGYEDVLFFDNLSQNGFEPYFFENPVLHQSDDDAKCFIKKTEMALENLTLLVKEGKINPDSQKIPSLYKKLKRLGLAGLVSFFWKLTKPALIANFSSNFASLFLFDCYRIGYYCHLKSKEITR